jgi:hypothetical protein
VQVAPGETRDIEFVATAGDWPLHCHRRHHPMNAMSHDMPNMIGVKQGSVEKDIQKLVPGYMAMDAAEQMKMQGPENTLPMMSGKGPFGDIGMGGMFTILKVRDAIVGNKVDGWYDNPKGTVASKVK